jgi:hypothetical protein
LESKDSWTSNNPDNAVGDGRGGW